MADDKAIVVVAGATGRAGRLIVKELISRKFTVRAMIVPPFDPPQPEGFSVPGIEIVEGSLESKESLEKVMGGADYLISAIGSTKYFNKKEFEKIDVTGNHNLAMAAKAKGVKQIVVISSIGAGNSRDAMTCIWRMMMGQVIKAKTKMEEALISTGIDYTFVRPGGYTEKELSGKIAIGEGGKFTGLVRRDQVATVCVDAIEKPAMKNRIFEVVDYSKIKEEHRQFVIEV